MAENLGYTSTNGAASVNAASLNSAISAQDAINRVFDNIQTKIADPYNAGYAAGQNSNSFNADSIVADIISKLNLNDPSNYLQSAVDLANLNTASSEAMAREQMAFQKEQNAIAMDFNATEAQKTRDWTSLMSDTAHQREVADLIKAGLNPILSANQGASTGSAANAIGVTSSGAKGSVDTGAVTALTQAYVQARQMEMQTYQLGLEQEKIAAQLEMNELTNKTNAYAAELNSSASRYGSELSSSAHRYAAELDYSTWTSGLHNQYAQLGEWIYKALSGIDFSKMFNFDFSNMISGLFKNEIPQVFKDADYTEGGGTGGAGGGGGGGGAWDKPSSSYEPIRKYDR